MTDLRNYALVTSAYWGFTLTDGALRMLVLLHFHELGYSPLQIAFLFLLYEFFGVVTNLVGGWIGSHIGLKVTLFSGLALQVVALGALAFLDPTWPVALSVAYVMGAQALSGIA
ncbi:MAG: MFS transporter, partial [Desulfuromonadales bacterium]|nr:MFS transporter [Desulfuromonadales bacterium]NIS42428.1 MFS transporter [Desulfuromonadales bacterium]